MTKLVFLALCSCLAAVGYYFFTLGAWLVAPFIGLESLVIGIGLYLQCLNAHRRQVIKIGATSISISDHKGKQHACFPRAWLKILHRQDPKGWYPSRLFIGSHGQYVEIGKFLVESERNSLADNLRCAIQGV